MGVRSSAEYDFWKRDEQEAVQGDPERGVMNAATNPEAVTHNGRISLVPERPHPPERRATEPTANMANEVMTQPEIGPRPGISSAEDHVLDAFLGKAFEEKPIWSGLWESIRDVFFPPKLPPLELTSKPIPVPDRMAVKTNPWAVGISSGINLIIAAILLFFVGKAVV